MKLDHPAALDGRGLRNHQADLVSRPGEDIMNLFYPSCLTSSSYSLSLGNSTKCDHRADSLSTKPLFLYIAFCVHSVNVMCPSITPTTIFFFIQNLLGFLPIPFFERCTHPLIKTWVYDFHGYGAACICENSKGLLNTIGIQAEGVGIEAEAAVTSTNERIRNEKTGCIL